MSARDGSFVTFDDWGRSGYGDNVVVIYSGTGKLIKKFTLRDLMTDAQIENLPRTIGSIEWGGRHIFEEGDSVLLLRIGIDNEWDVDKRKYRDVEVRMSDGALVKQ